VDILIVKLSALGDVVQALPVVRALKTAFPQARIHWLAEETAAPIVRLHPGVDRVLVSSRRKWGRDWRYPFQWLEMFREIGGLTRQLRGPRFDLILDLQGLFKSGVWTRIARASLKVGYNGREGSQLFLTERIPVVDPDQHAVDRYMHLAEVVGGRTEEVCFGLASSPAARTRSWELFQSAGGQIDYPYVVVVPTARWETKLWSAARFAVVADRLIEQFALQIVFTGVDSDRAAILQIVQRMQHPAVNLAGKTDLEEMTALLENARLVISVDSGPMHLAAALGRPVVALFGPTAPWRTGPYGRGHRIVRALLSCSPCFRRECAHKTCMTSIDSVEVIAAVSGLLGDSAGERRETISDLTMYR
jgi:heptosyltransferase-1